MMKHYNYMKIPMAKSVRIGPDVYQVVGMVCSISRGQEYQLSQGRGRVERMCFAPDYKVKSAIAHGETIHYTW